MTTTLRFPSGLYGITPEWDDTDRLLKAVSEAHRGGMTVLQWRRKLAAPALATAQLNELLALCRELSLPLLINDGWKVALAVAADGAHLGRDDGDLAEARAVLSPPRYVGASCYDQPELARLALEKNVDYVAFGAMFSSSVKPDAVRALPEHLQQGRALCQAFAHDNRRAAVVAIGGITPENALEVIQAGADSIAVISSLFEAPDIYERARQFNRLFTAAH
ncbi:thiamine phosphate synthase [Paenalcaligenes niemegkensis]|uniref:thiamine phosphate synthase n=1 Tax=Paenalcaligenes niemegkensis TaxID=2895469 RepID=UPI001EE8352C|nr:thiamine phosphate synthase [Paenalcaligenes niemegkensis]MCQ9615472.1 thiamine phosphate synthase [Paenalcaligenes niemegkensis]